MARQEEDPLRIGHMIEYARKALRFVKGKKRSDLEQDDMRRLAVVRAIEVIGEAASRVTPTTRQQHPEVPWTRIAKMRNRLIHGYDQIDYDLLWQVLEDRLYPLIGQLRAILSEPGEPKKKPKRRR